MESHSEFGIFLWECFCSSHEEASSAHCSQKTTFHGVIPQDQSGCLSLSLATTDYDTKLHKTVWYRINGWTLNVAWQSSVPY